MYDSYYIYIYLPVCEYILYLYLSIENFTSALSVIARVLTVHANTSAIRQLMTQKKRWKIYAIQCFTEKPRTFFVVLTQTRVNLKIIFNVQADLKSVVQTKSIKTEHQNILNNLQTSINTSINKHKQA